MPLLACSPCPGKVKEKGISPVRLKVVGLGIFSDDQSEQGKKLSRRGELKFIK